MSNQSLKNHQFDRNFEGKNEVWDDDDFLQDLNRRIEELEAGKVTGSIWEEVKAKSKHSLGRYIS